MTDLLTGILGLPTHPLVVHFSVVLLPLSALSLLIAVVWRWWRIRFAGLSVAGLLVATGATVLAKESGERLAEVVGTPQEHAEWAEILVPVAAATLVVAVIWYLLQWRARRRALEGAASRSADDSVTSPEVAQPRAGVPATIAGVVLALGAIAVLVVVALVGHSGAQATWSGTL